MEKNLVDLVAKILDAMTYMIFGGLLLTTFFCVFAPWVMGISKMQHHLAMLEKKSEDTNRLLASIDEQLKKLSQTKDTNKS